MSSPETSAEVSAAIEQAFADHKVSDANLLGVPRELTDAVARAGFQSTTGTIAFAGRHASGGFSVQYNDQNGGFSSSWPQWAYELAKDALLGNKRVWVASNGSPFGSNLIFVLILG